MKLLIMGAGGYMGSVYLGVLKTFGFPDESLFLVDRDEERARRLKSRYPKAKVSLTLDSVKSKGGLNGAIVVTNTPSHHLATMELLRMGVKNILIEKPLAVNLSAVKDIEKDIGKANVFTSFPLHFSGPFCRVEEIMREKKLYLKRLFVDFGKDRSTDERPTVGNMEDEAVHAVALLHALVEIRERINYVELTADLTFNSFVHEKIQQEAHSLDNVPLSPSDSTAIVVRLLTRKNKSISALINSSYLALQRSYVARGILCADEGKDPYLFQMDFNTPAGDVLLLKVAGNSEEPKREVFVKSKVGAVLDAFLKVTKGKKADAGLVPFRLGKEIVAFTETAKKSYEQKKLFGLAYALV
jgi:predicted dehydrogenase